MPTQHESNPAGSTTPMPWMDATPHLSTRALAWLTEHPRTRRFVRSVWDKLTELERTGQHLEAIDALRRVLTHHQPTAAGRCRTCRRWTSRHPPFPCIVWHQIHGELLGQFPDCGRHRPPAEGRGPRHGLSHPRDPSRPPVE